MDERIPMVKTEHPYNIGKLRTLTAIDKVKASFIIDDEIHCKQRGAAHEKLIYLQRLKHIPGGRIEYRFTYYMRGLKRGNWVFGQYSLMIPERELKWLLQIGRAH